MSSQRANVTSPSGPGADDKASHCHMERYGIGRSGRRRVGVARRITLSPHVVTAILLPVRRQLAADRQVEFAVTGV